MKLGFLAGFSEDIVKFAGDGPFECLEVGIPGEWVGDSSAAGVAREKAKALLDKHGIIIASFQVPMPSIRTSKEELQEQLARLSQIIDVASFMGGAVLTGAGPRGYDPSKNLANNVAMFKEVYAPIAELLTKKGAKMGFENWPAGRPFSDNASLAATPESWEAMFAAVDAESLGLEFDPSHLIWQWVDPYQAARDFAKKIKMVHLKDTEINNDRLSKVGTQGGGWWRYRLPGFGCLDWWKFFAILNEEGYKGNAVIEHEDPVFSGERHLEGLTISGRYLRQLIFA
ncbi:sugar phosphate isomerase/epimerase [Candidatus Poribacteria bacterium]|nr:sugar phosphate isomerase/epimerase [Candidatus Poribacteria bacterium]